MGSSTRHGIALALLALGAQGCLTGHLLDAARRREQPVAYHDASIDGGRLLLGYSAVVSDDQGRHLERTERRGGRAPPPPPPAGPGVSALPPPPAPARAPPP